MLKKNNNNDNNNNNNNNNNNKKKNSSIFPPQEKKDSYNTPDGGPHSNSQGIGAVNCCRKDLHPRGRSYPRFSSFFM